MNMRLMIRIVPLALVGALAACSQSDSGEPNSGDGDGDVSGDGDLGGDGDSATGGSTNGAGGSTGDGDLPDMPSSGCGAADPPTGPQSLMVGDLERTYIVSLPDGYDPSVSYPVIFAFHGLGNSGSGVMSEWYLGIEQKGGTPSIFVYPDGLDDGGGTGWPNMGGRDVAFFDAMVESLKSTYCVDENRIFSTGHSFGGIMSFTLACDRANVLRAVAPVAGARWAQNDCMGPIAALGIHGDPDNDVPYENGLSAISRIVETNGCNTDAATPVAPTEFCESYACDPDYPVTWCAHDSGHDWPDFAAQMIKDFFDGF